MSVIVGILIPFIGTTLGASLVYLMKKGINDRFEKILLGFASGVMIAASVWSLLIPAINMSESQGKIPWMPPVIGFLIGILFLMLLDRIIPHLHLHSKMPEGPASKLKKTTMLTLAVTLHNFPEGMAVGVVFAGILAGNELVSIAGAFVLSIGIAIQNIPEGAIISMPLKNEGVNKHKAFLAGMLSGVVEPIGAVITICLTGLAVPLLPYLLSFAAGAMIYVVVEELIPSSQEGKGADLGTMGVALGFVIMMILDVALG